MASLHTTTFVRKVFTDLLQFLKLNCTYLQKKKEIKNRNFTKAQNHNLWMGQTSITDLDKRYLKIEKSSIKQLVSNTYQSPKIFHFRVSNRWHLCCTKVFFDIWEMIMPLLPKLLLLLWQNSKSKFCVWLGQNEEVKETET